VDTAPRAGQDVIRLGLVAGPGLPADVAADLAEDLPGLLAESVSSDVTWNVSMVVEPRAGEPGASAADVIEAARERMLGEGWTLAMCLTDLPLRVGRRPVVADASATHGVGVVSLPALGAVHLRRRAGDAMVRLVDGLMGERMLERDEAGRRRRVGRRLVELAAPVRRVVPDGDEDIDVRYVAAVVRGNLRLLAGMVRANRPWRLIVGLSRALAAALGAAVFALVTPDIWPLADAQGSVRLIALTAVSVAATVVSLIVAHELWERPSDPRVRPQVVLFNVATALTVTLGVATLYVGLCVLVLGGAALVLTTGVLSSELGHHAGIADYAELAWFVSSLATVGGALGGGLESDAAVRQAAYGSHPDEG
jgi:hypothetical protein